MRRTRRGVCPLERHYARRSPISRFIGCLALRLATYRTIAQKVKCTLTQVLAKKEGDVVRHVCVAVGERQEQRLSRGKRMGKCPHAPFLLTKPSPAHITRSSPSPLSPATLPTSFSHRSRRSGCRRYSCRPYIVGLHPLPHERHMSRILRATPRPRSRLLSVIKLFRTVLQSALGHPPDKFGLLHPISAKPRPLRFPADGPWWHPASHFFLPRRRFDS